MDNQEFEQLLWQANDGETAAVLAAVDLDPALLTRADTFRIRLLHDACLGGHLELVTELLAMEAQYRADISAARAAKKSAPESGQRPRKQRRQRAAWG